MASRIGGADTPRTPGWWRRPRGSRPYRKRHPLPAIALVTVLCVVTAVVWLNVAMDRSNIDDDIRCHPAATPQTGVTFTPLPHDALRGTTPLPPGEVSARVLNASNSLGQAGRTTEKLNGIGFTQLADPANDPAYEDQEADCHGQIRFGTNGRAAARTLSLLAPCLELIKVNRADAGVDVAVGANFRDIHLSDAAKRILERLKASEDNPSTTHGAEQAAGSTPSIDPDLLRKARSGYC